MRLLLDVDTGVDDAMAILFAVGHPGIDLLGIGCVAGNTTLENVVTNTLRVLDIAGADDVPVAVGAPRPLLAPARPSHFHGVDGLADLDLPAPSRAPVAEPAVEFYREAILAAEGPVTLAGIGPLTDFALLLRQHPELADRVERLVFMGGAVSGGNATPVAEFNVWQDPEATAICLDAGVPVEMYPLDVFTRMRVPAAERAALAAAPRRAAPFVARLLDHLAPEPVDPAHVAGIGDAGAIVWLARPDLFEAGEFPVRVELEGRSRAQTVVDRRIHVGEDAVHGAAGDDGLVRVVLDGDVPGVIREFTQAIGRLP